MNRLDILQTLIDRFAYRSYLELGVARGSTFRNVSIERKIGVDPRWRLSNAFDPRVKKTTSDRFFDRNREAFDLIFIDGLHIAEQAWRDIENSLGALRPEGLILLHDCSPASREEQMVPRVQTAWTGDVWRALLKTTQQEDLWALILDVDQGCGLIGRGTPGGTPAGFPSERNPLFEEEISWEEYRDDRENWIEVVPGERVASELRTIRVDGRNGAA